MQPFQHSLPSTHLSQRRECTEHLCHKPPACWSGSGTPPTYYPTCPPTTHTYAPYPPITHTRTRKGHTHTHTHTHTRTKQEAPPSTRAVIAPPKTTPIVPGSTACAHPITNVSHSVTPHIRHLSARIFTHVLFPSPPHQLPQSFTHGREHQ